MGFVSLQPMRAAGSDQRVGGTPRQCPVRAMRIRPTRKAGQIDWPKKNMLTPDLPAARSIWPLAVLRLHDRAEFREKFVCQLMHRVFDLAWR